MSTSPFPGMDPYLEAPERWADFHHALAERIKAALNGMLGESYFARVEVRTVWYGGDKGDVQFGYPDVAILRDAAALYTPAPNSTWPLSDGLHRSPNGCAYTPCVSTPSQAAN